MRAAVGRLVLVELAAVQEPGQDLVGVVGPAAVDGDDAVELVGRVERRRRLAAGEGGGGAPRHLGELAAQRRQAGGVVGVAVVDVARDVALDDRPAQLLVLDPLADRRLHQVRAGEEDRAGALDDVRLVAHDRQVGAAGDARAHDRGELEDAGGGEPRVVVEGAAEVLAVGEDLVLHRQEDAGRVDQVDDRQAVLEGDLLGAEDLLAGQREPGAGLDRGVVGDHHHVAAVDRADPHHHARRRGAAVLLVEAVGGPQAELEERRAGVAEGGHPLAGGHLPLRPLLGLRLLAAAQADRRLLLAQPLDRAAPVRRAARERVVPLQLAGQHAQAVPSFANAGIIWDGAKGAGR